MAIHYVLTGRMWATRAAITRAIEVTGNTVSSAVGNGSVLIVGNDIITKSGNIVKPSRKLAQAKKLGCRIVHETDARRVLESNRASMQALTAKVPDGITPRQAEEQLALDSERTARATKAQATRAAQRAKEQEATRTRTAAQRIKDKAAKAKADEAAMAELRATVVATDDVFGDL